MTKEEIVQKAFGEHWPTFEKLADKDGWVSEQDFWHMEAEDLFSIETESYYEYGYEMGVVRWRPSMIEELIMNNGWNKINSPEDYPEKYTKGFIVKDNNIFEMCEHRSGNVWWCYKWKRLIENPTHYRKSEELELPLH